MKRILWTLFFAVALLALGTAVVAALNLRGEATVGQIAILAMPHTSAANSGPSGAPTSEWKAASATTAKHSPSGGPKITSALG